jgi:DNA-binding MarR family transcriptional regulator
MREEELYRLQRQVKALYRRVQRERPAIEGLSHTSLQVMVTLERAGGALRPGQLAGELQMTTSNVAATLRSLEAENFVTRHPDPEDGRRALVSLTPAGAKMVAQARRERSAWLQQAITDLLAPDEQRLLLRAGELMQQLAEYPASAGDTRP